LNAEGDWRKERSFQRLQYLLECKGGPRKGRAWGKKEVHEKALRKTGMREKLERLFRTESPGKKKNEKREESELHGQRRCLGKTVFSHPTQTAAGKREKLAKKGEEPRGANWTGGEGEKTCFCLVTYNTEAQNKRKRGKRSKKRDDSLLEVLASNRR